MTRPATKLLHNAIAEAGKSAGFRKEGTSWYCSEAGAILLISPQKSQYGSQYFLNLGVYWRAFGDKIAPREEECHLRGRMSSLVPREESQRLEQSLDFENLSVDDEARRVTVRDALSQHAIPLLKRCSTIRGIREEHQKGTLRRFLVERSLAAMIDAQSQGP